MRPSISAAAIAAGVVSVLTIALAHDDPAGQHYLDAQPPYTGPGFTEAAGGAVPVSFPASGVSLRSWVPVTTFNSAFSSANTCESYVSLSGREYAIIGLSGGTGFVEVTDPGNPVIVAVMTGPTSLWRDLRTYSTFCYAVSEGGSGIQVFDLSAIDSGVVTLANTITTGGVTATHTLFINKDSGYLYRCGGGTSTVQGLRIYNLNPNPAAPAFVASWSTRYVHECQVVNWTSGPFAGKEVAFAYADDTSGGGNPGIVILDVSNKAAVTAISSIGYPNAGFSHQGWLSIDRKYIYFDDELDESDFGIFSLTRVFDVQNLAAPFLTSSFSTGLPSIDHNQYTKGNLLFQANYRAGLRVFDTTNPTAPVQVASFDTYPQDDSANFNGLWDNDPFLPSGTIIGSDIEKGLFVWRLGPPELVYSFPDGTPSMIPTTGASFRVVITPSPGQSVLPGTPKLRYNAGSGEVLADLVPVSGDTYQATIPGVPCGADVAYYFTAQAATGLTAREPATAPASLYHATVATTITTTFQDAMETDTGWTLGAPGDTATTGLWVRADPVGTAAQPEDDNPMGAGTLCWVTGNAAPGAGVGVNDVDGGATTLTSPMLDGVAQPGIAFVTYARWYSNDQGSNPGSDSMPVQISGNNGASWTQLELVTENAGEWVTKNFRIDQFVTPTSQVRLRFIARDDAGGSIVEAGVDDVRIYFIVCAVPPPPPCPGDANGDRVIDFADITGVFTNWGVSYGVGNTGPGDANHDGVVDFADVTGVFSNWAGACP